MRCDENPNAGFAWRAQHNGFSDCYLHVHLPQRGSPVEVIRVRGTTRISSVLAVLSTKYMPDCKDMFRCA